VRYANQLPQPIESLIVRLKAEKPYSSAKMASPGVASNANKFTEKGTVSIAAHEGQESGRGWMTLSVADTGIGMTAEQMGKLFQEFSQASSTTASKSAARALGS
jgi:signal transduction histidine kinase